MDLRRRWKTGGDYILIRKMEDKHLINAIRYVLRKRGHKHTKLSRLVEEARRRGLPVPRHKWIEEPAPTEPRQLLAAPPYRPEGVWGECPRCRGTIVLIGDGSRGRCLNCDRLLDIAE